MLFWPDGAVFMSFLFDESLPFLIRLSPNEGRLFDDECILPSHQFVDILHIALDNGLHSGAFGDQLVSLASITDDCLIFLKVLHHSEVIDQVFETG